VTQRPRKVWQDTRGRFSPWSWFLSSHFFDDWVPIAWTSRKSWQQSSGWGLCVGPLWRQRMRLGRFFYRWCNCQCFRCGFRRCRTDFTNQCYFGVLDRQPGPLCTFRPGMPLRGSVLCEPHCVTAAGCAIVRSLDHGQVLRSQGLHRDEVDCFGLEKQYSRK